LRKGGREGFNNLSEKRYRKRSAGALGVSPDQIPLSPSFGYAQDRLFSKGGKFLLPLKKGGWEGFIRLICHSGLDPESRGRTVDSRSPIRSRTSFAGMTIPLRERGDLEGGWKRCAIQ